MEYKKLYSEAEVQGLKEWFEQRLDTLPASLQLDAATFIPDLHRAVKQLLEIAMLQRGTPAFSGQIFQLFKIREKLEEA